LRPDNKLVVQSPANVFTDLMRMGRFKAMEDFILRLTLAFYIFIVIIAYPVKTKAG
jgi:hypothetical protein